jgi:3-hydroxy acid dehydrogenase/malonic semialdehyde reductase
MATTALITGASSGIGEACARAFARAGFDLVLTARREDKLRALAAELGVRHQISTEVFGLDVRSLSAVRELVAAQPASFAAIDVLVNNAGLAQGFDSLQDGNPEDWDVMIDTNVKGLLYMTRAVLPRMISRGQGHIVNIGSVAGRWAYPKGNVYCATKAAVRMLSEAMRQDLHGTGIRVTEIEPGMVETDFSRVRFAGDEAKASAVYAGTEPLTADDIADAVLWSVQRPKRVNIQEMVIFPTAQSAVGMVKRQ